LDKPLYIGEVDASDNEELKERYNVTDFPSFIAIYAFGRDPEVLNIVKTDVYKTF
jgi:hypothetical protein